MRSAVAHNHLFETHGHQSYSSQTKLPFTGFSWGKLPSWKQLNLISDHYSNFTHGEAEASKAKHLSKNFEVHLTELCKLSLLSTWETLFKLLLWWAEHRYCKTLVALPENKTVLVFSPTITKSSHMQVSFCLTAGLAIVRGSGNSCTPYRIHTATGSACLQNRLWLSQQCSAAMNTSYQSLIKDRHS